MRLLSKLAGFSGAGVLLYLLYLPGLAGPFVYDDHATITHNAGIQSRSIITVLSENPFRALPNLTFAAQYHLHFQPERNQPRPRPFHLFNLFLHWLNGLVLYGLLRQLQPRNHGWAWAAALLFLGHPLVTESVNFITARFGLMATLGCLAAASFYLQAEAKPRRLLLFWLCFLLALLCKETSATLPAVLFLLNRLRGRPQKHLPALVLLILAYLGLRLSWTIILAARPGQTLDTFHYFLLQNRVLWLYLQKFLWPVHLSFDYQLTYPVWSLIICLVINLAGVALCGFLLRQGSLPAVALLIWLILFLPTSSLIPLADPVKEYHAYLPATAGIPLLAAGFFSGNKFLPWRRALFVPLMLFMLALTFQRNLTWQSEEKLWRDAVTHAPLKHRAVYNYAQTLRRQLKLEQALFYYHRALKLDPAHQRTRENIEMVQQALQSPELESWKQELKRRRAEE